SVERLAEVTLSRLCSLNLALAVEGGELGFGVLPGADDGLERFELGAQRGDFAVPIGHPAAMLEMQSRQIALRFVEQRPQRDQAGADQAIAEDHGFQTFGSDLV